jgi:alpha-glucosidase
MVDMGRLIIVLLLVIQSVNASGRDYRLLSPGGTRSVVVELDDRISYSVFSGTEQLLAPSEISVTVGNGEVLGTTPRLKKESRQSVNETLHTALYKKSKVSNSFNELTLTFSGDYGVVFRAYDDGIAYRFFTTRSGPMIVVSEQAEFNFNSDHMTWVQYVNRWGEGDIYYTTFENSYANLPLSGIADKDTLIVAPSIVDIGTYKLALTESDLEDYPGMFLAKGDKGYSLKGAFAGVPVYDKDKGGVKFSGDNLEEVVRGDRNGFISETEGNRSFPWRIIVIADRDADLANNDMVYRLASPSRVEDGSWIKPGKVAWDWWIECDLWDVDFKAGVNYNTYREYINFASANRLEYIIIDVGFSKTEDVMQTNPDIRLPELITHADSMGVGIIAWTGWLGIRDQMEEACEYYSGLGIKGFKVDYMNRNDQDIIDFYFSLAEIAARNHLVLDFHGASPPAGLNITYPNVLTFEGVKGQEWCRWTNPDQPAHAVTFPYIRMLAGPVDFTPGVFRSESKGRFKISWNGSMGQGTRAHQMAMYTVFESPLQMLSDSPSRYREEQECTDFIAGVPAVWDKTIALDGEIGKYIVMARKSGNTWYVGALTSWEGREVNIDLSFLEPGEYDMVFFSDGANANRYARDYKREEIIITPDETIEARLASGGGWTARITPRNR